MKAADMLGDDAHVVRRMRIAEDVRDEKQHGHGAGAQAGRNDVLRDGREGSGVQIEADHGEHEGRHEYWSRSDVQRSDQRDRDEDRAEQKPDDPDL